MKLIDLLIIYFACGAPFGVYQFTAVRNPLTPQVVFLVFLRICFWPLFAVLTLIDWISKNNQSAEANLDRRIDSLRAAIESLVFGHDSVSSIFDFREVLNRYAGLAAAAHGGIASNVGNEIFDLGGTGNKEIASACLARKNQRNLSFHHSLVRSEFVDMISEFAATERQSQRVLELAVDLAEGLSDKEAVSELTTMIAKIKIEPSGEELDSRIPKVGSHQVSSHF